MKVMWKILIPLILIAATGNAFAAGDQQRGQIGHDISSGPTLQIKNFPGGSGADGRNIALLLAAQDLIRDNFTLVGENARFTISGEIHREGLGHTAIFILSEAEREHGRESIWFRDFVELPVYMPTITGMLIRNVMPQFIIRNPLPLPQFTDPFPQPPVQPSILPELELIDFSGGPGGDGKNITAMLAAQSLIRDNFTLTDENARFTISGEIHRDGLGHMVTFVLSEGNRVHGREAFWYRDLVELPYFMPTITSNLISSIKPQLAVRTPLPLPEITGPPADPIAPPPMIHPEAAPPEVLVRREIPAALRAFQVYLGGGLGLEASSHRFVHRFWNPAHNRWEWEERHDMGTTIAFGAMCDLVLTRFFSVGLGFILADDLLVPVMAKIGGRFGRIGLSGNVGYAFGTFGGFAYGATVGFNLGRNIIFSEVIATSGSGHNSRHNAVNVIVGYKFGLFDTR